jgi:hypothetical protein
MQFVESSLAELYQSAVDAFPRTRFRQHSVDPVEIVSLGWTPFVGMRTLFLKGVAQNFDSTPFSEYTPIIMFKGVVYHEQLAPRRIRFMADDGKEYIVERFSLAGEDVQVRCNCPDFSWRFNYYNHLDKSLYGRKRTKYEGTTVPANPKEMPGMCKHLMKMSQALVDVGLIV